MIKLMITNYHGWTLSKLRKERTKRSNSKKAYQKITVVIMSWKGKQVTEIADLLQIHHQTVRKYIKAFNEGGLEMLLDYKKATGRPTKLSEQEQELCKEMVCLTPSDINYDISVNWNTKILKDFINDNFGKDVNRSTISRMLKKLGFSYTRPTYVLAKADKEKQAAFKDAFEELKKTNS